MAQADWRKRLLIGCLGGSLFVVSGMACAEADSPSVGITEDMPFVLINHRGVPVRVERVQDVENRLSDDFTKTSRPCPPFCIHAMESAPGVRTIGELELIDFLTTEVESETGLLIDARIASWYRSETIPGAVNVPFVLFSEQSGKLDAILELLGATRIETGGFDFSAALDLALFCNGPWCDQSPRAIRSLLTRGYPAEKLMYYRGGMQAWKSFGLTTLIPERHEIPR